MPGKSIQMLTTGFNAAHVRTRCNGLKTFQSFDCATFELHVTKAGMHVMAHVARAKFWPPNASQNLRYQCPQHQREVRWEQNCFYVLGFSRGLELRAVRIILDVTAVNEDGA